MSPYPASQIISSTCSSKCRSSISSLHSSLFTSALRKEGGREKSPRFHLSKVMLPGAKSARDHKDHAKNPTLFHNSKLALFLLPPLLGRSCQSCLWNISPHPTHTSKNIHTHTQTPLSSFLLLYSTTQSLDTTPPAARPPQSPGLLGAGGTLACWGLDRAGIYHLVVQLT